MITLRHTTFDRDPLDEWSTRRRDLYLITKTLTANIHDPSGIRTHNSSKRLGADPRLRLRGQWDGHQPPLPPGNILDSRFYRSWVDYSSVERPQGLCQLINPMVPSGIKSTTFQLAAQCLHQLRHFTCPCLNNYDVKIMLIFFLLYIFSW